MGQFRDQYFNTLGIGRSYEKLESALDRAYQLRTFEIEHYWKRATYFWGFQVAIFAAFGLLWKDAAANQWGPITVVLAAVGLLTAVANYLSAHGSKFWQQNWEHHIDMLEDGPEGRLHKTVWLSGGQTSWSVSRVNLTLSRCFIVFWLIVASYVVWRFLGSPQARWPAGITSRGVYTAAVILATLSGVLWLLCQTSNLRGTVPNTDGSHGAGIRPCSCGSRRLCLEKNTSFVRRYAPDEG